MDDAENKIDSDDVREALRLIRESGALGDGKLLLLLDYLVTEELAGRGDRLKGYSIALDVFNRGTDFDPSIDSVVRVEMLRLRKALAGYYTRPQSGPHVVINLAKGSYRPTFSRVADFAADSQATRGGRRFAVITVCGAIAAMIFVLFVASSLGVFASLKKGGGARCARPALALRLEGFEKVRQVQLQGVFSEIMQAYPLVLAGTAPKGCVEMQHALGLTRISDWTMQAALYHEGEGHPYWVQVFTVDERDDDMDLLMAQILYRVVSHEGALIKGELRDAWSSDKDKRDYVCHVNNYSHFVNPSTDDPADDLACLRASMKADSPFADTYSTYAIFAQLRFFDPALYGDGDPAARLAEYNSAIARALAIDPTDCLAMAARLREYRRAVPPDHERLAETVETMKRYCAGNPFMLNHIAIVEGYVFDDWAESRALLDKTIAISGLKPWYTHALLGNLMTAGRWQEAHDKLEFFQSILNPVDAIWMIIVGNRADDRKMVGDGVKFLELRSVRSYEDLEKYFTEAGYHPDFTEELLAELAATFPPNEGRKKITPAKAGVS